MNTNSKMSAQPCGCDPAINYQCSQHLHITLEGPDGYSSIIDEPSTFQVKDSGVRQSFAGGMVRDVTTGKIDYSLILDGPMFKRWADHLTKGAIKYDKRNWMKAEGKEEYNRFRESALRHFLQWYWGELDEDHAAAVLFNINGAEYVKGRLA